MAPLACAAANLLAVIALATVLAPGTPVVTDVAERERYVTEHLVAWRIGWATWMVAAATLVWCYVWWRARVGAPRAAVALAVAGIVADWIAELMLVAGDYKTVAALSFFMTGAIANGLYTVAGIWLTMRTPLPSAARAVAAVMWSAGSLVSVGAALQIAIVTAGATAVLFAFFVPWCVWLGVWLGAPAR